MKRMLALALMATMALAIFVPAAMAQDDDVNGMDDDVAGMDEANGAQDDDGNGIDDDDGVVPRQPGAAGAVQYDDDANGVDDGAGAAAPGGVSALPDTGGPALLLVGGALLALGAASFGISVFVRRR